MRTLLIGVACVVALAVPYLATAQDKKPAEPQARYELTVYKMQVVKQKERDDEIFFVVNSKRQRSNQIRKDWDEKDAYWYGFGGAAPTERAENDDDNFRHYLGKVAEGGNALVVEVHDEESFNKSELIGTVKFTVKDGELKAEAENAKITEFEQVGKKKNYSVVIKSGMFDCSYRIFVKMRDE
jgi:hypothetical protein